MTKVLAYVSPARGHLYPATGVLVELRRRGHEVGLRCLAGEVEAMLELGFEAAPIDPALESLEMDDWRARSRVGAIRHAVRVVGARARLDAPDLMRAIERERPDVLLVDVLAWGALSAAESWGGPWACFAPLPLPLASRAGPPMGPGWRPAHGAVGRLRDWVGQMVFRSGYDRLVLPDLNTVRSELGLRSFGHAEELFLAPPLLLCMTAEPFEYPRPDWPERIVMVGPCAWEPPGKLPGELAALEEPLVLVTTSTEFQDDSRLVAVAIEALASEPVHVVATLPASVEGASPPSTENSTVLRFAPHTPILERAACAITHGGMGATQKALACGVPVCAVPFGRDQADVARRVEVAGAGSRLPAARLRPERLRAKVREAIGRRAGAERVARAFVAAGGAGAAADAFEQMLDERASVAP